MLLSRLEISGFKSFPEKTIIEFDSGITGVVGPNGCGKSNILDSIRWVLGEQRTSVLRSSRMEQIIFSGTSTLNPTGMAEVTLYIKNNRGLLPIEYDDISITRRLYRSGESEYMINKNACRLKDIVELFFDTGMGAHAYSVIQQGMIDAILSDKTEDRRSLFEEAAGVTKYKHRKKEAENKLAATEADLLRIGDVISEIEKQVVTLRRQAKRANRYAAQKDKLKEIECLLSAGRLYDSERQFGGLSESKRELNTLIEAFTAEIDKFQINLQENKLKLTEIEKEAGEFRQKNSDLAVKAAGFENEIRMLNHRAETSTEEIKNCGAEIVALENRIETLKKQIEDYSGRIEENELQRKSSSGLSETLEGELEELLSRQNDSDSDLEQKRKIHQALSERISSVKTEIAYLRESKISLSSKLNNLDDDTRQFDKIRDESTTDLSNLDNTRNGIASKIEESQAQKDTLIQQKEKYVSILTELREKLASKQAEQSGLEARRELFEQMIETGEGYTSGAAVLRSWPDAPEDINLPLAEVLEVPERYRVAVAAALGDMGEIVPVSSFRDAYAAIEYLKANSLGRASFLVLDKIDVSNIENNRPRSDSGFVGFLDQLVSCPDEYKPAVSLLLGRVGLFKTKDAASNAGDQWEHFTRVTIDGLALLPSGFVSGGKTSPGVLGRRQDLGAVRENLGALKGGIEQIDSGIVENRQALDNTNLALVGIEEDIIKLEDEYNRIGAEFNQLKFDFKEQENRYSSAKSEAERLKAEMDGQDSRLISLESEFQELKNNCTKAETDLDNAGGRVDELRIGIRELESKLTATRIKNVELDGISDKLRSDIVHNDELCSEASRMIETNRGTIKKADKTITVAHENIEKLKISLEECFNEKNEVKLKLNDFDGQIAEMITGIGELEDRIGNKRKEKEELVSDLHSLDMRFLELDSARKSTLERLNLEFGITSIQPAPLPEDQTIESLENRAEGIRESLKRIEPVNLMAAEDYERENDRVNFLIRQRDDLIEAKTSLQEAIVRINVTAENCFDETFQGIARNFERVFLSLFEGGEARVELEDPSNPLESPIKISARPGGKKMLTVTQLSGGERALTAISLLFGIYLVKPSPFCILDEVDAPLDDANLMRFLKLIKDFAEKTQFIIITHNKLTMEASDILYGVTMQTPGVSKVVSVKFSGNGNRE